MKDASPIRSLVVLPNWVGDTVMALPVLEALAGSGRQVVALARPHLLPLLELVGAIDESVERRGDESETIAAIAASDCQEAVLLPNSFRSAYLPWRAGVPYRWGYAGNLRTVLLAPPVPRPRRRRAASRHQIRDYAELLSALDVAEPASWVPRLALPAPAREAGAERLRRAGLDPAARLVGLFAGAEFGPSKRWPWERFAALARELRRSDPGLGCVVVAGPKEVWTAVRIHEETGKIHPVIGPDLDLGGLAGALAHLDLLVTNDSGPMHLAAAVGVPCLALFGPTDPRRTAPSGPGHEVLYTDRWCSPCFRRRCPLLHHRCLRDIGVEEVAERALSMLPPP